MTPASHAGGPEFDPRFAYFHTSGRIAQMVEHGSNKPRVGGSSPSVTTFCPTQRFYGVMVSTLDFESSDPGSNPGRTSILPAGHPGPVRRCTAFAEGTASHTPPWLSWQSARLLTDRSLVRAQVEAPFCRSRPLAKSLCPAMRQTITPARSPDPLGRPGPPIFSFSSLDLFRVV